MIIKPKNKMIDVFDINYDVILEEAYIKHKKLIVAFDFDNTIFDYHKKEVDYSKIINLLKECQDLGFILKLFTSETSKDKLDWKIKYCTEILGLNINQTKNENDLSKVYANIYLDDKAGLYEAFSRLKFLIEKIKLQSNVNQYFNYNFLTQ